MAWTTTEDILDRWIGEEIPATEDQLTVLIDDAEDLLAVEAPDLASKIGSQIPQARAVRVIVGMIHRVLRNPDGLRQRMHTAGPFSEQVMYSGDSPGGLEFTAADRRALEGRSTRVRRAFTLYPAGI